MTLIKILHIGKEKEKNGIKIKSIKLLIQGNEAYCNIELNVIIKLNLFEGQSWKIDFGRIITEPDYNFITNVIFKEEIIEKETFKKINYMKIPEGKINIEYI